MAKGEGTSARKGGWWDAQARRVEATRQEVARAGPPRRAGGADGRRREVEQASRQEEGENGLFCNFQKFQGPECKPAITFKLKLK